MRDHLFGWDWIRMNFIFENWSNLERRRREGGRRRRISMMRMRLSKIIRRGIAKVSSSWLSPPKTWIILPVKIFKVKVFLDLKVWKECSLEIAIESFQKPGRENINKMACVKKNPAWSFSNFPFHSLNIFSFKTAQL